MAETQYLFGEKVEGNWKLQLLTFWEEFKQFFRYTERERTLVRIQLAKRSLEEALRQGINVDDAFDCLERAEDLFVEEDFERAREKADRCLRMLQVERTRNLDPLFTAGRIKRNYPELPDSDVERKHLVLRVIAELDRRQDLFTEREIRRVLEEAYPERSGVLMKTCGQVLDSHGDVVEDVVFAGISLYVWRGDSLA